MDFMGSKRVMTAAQLPGKPPFRNAASDPPRSDQQAKRLNLGPFRHRATFECVIMNMSGHNIRTSPVFRILAITLLSTTALSVSLSAVVEANHKPTRERIAKPRDCTPINGRNGYYGNPWCEKAYYQDEDPAWKRYWRSKKRG
jgi:hypothetical protein